jgi:hypothetical protein
MLKNIFKHFKQATGKISEGLISEAQNGFRKKLLMHTLHFSIVLISFYSYPVPHY